MKEEQQAKIILLTWACDYFHKHAMVKRLLDTCVHSHPLLLLSLVTSFLSDAFPTNIPGTTGKLRS